VSYVPEVSVTVAVSVQVDEDIDPVQLEAKIRAEGMRAGRELFASACVAIERAAMQGAGARQRREKRWVATTMGRCRIERWRVAPRQSGSFHPLDRALGWSQAEPSAGLRELGCDLALRLPFRQAAQVIARITDDEASAQSIWRIVQAEGRRLRQDHHRLEDDLLHHGIAPAFEGAAPELVVIEADGTFVRAQREASKVIKVRTAVSYHNKAPAGGRRHRRWRLVGKHCYATTSATNTFGRAIAVDGIARYRLNRVRHILACHDGEDEFGLTFRAWFPKAVHQIDQWHVAARLWEAVGQDTQRFSILRRKTFDDPVKTATWIRRGAYGVKPSEAPLLANYLEEIAPQLWGIRRLPRHLRRGRMFIRGSAVVEKHQDLLVGRRMKRRGMRWTRKGADHLLALQAARFSDAWPTRWGVVAA
jgi:hypothetical protein